MSKEFASSRVTTETVAKPVRADGVHGLYQRHLAEPGSLSIGQLAKISHRLSSTERATIKEKLSEVGEIFWKRWQEFRCGVTDQGEATPDTQPNFYHVVDLLGVAPQFANFALAGVRERQQKEDTNVVILDLMGGTAHIAKHLTRRIKPSGYILVDDNPRVEKIAQKQLEKLQTPNSHVVIHDLSEGLPPSLSGKIDEIKKKTSNGQKTELAVVSNWGLTYLIAEDILKVAGQCFDPNFNTGVRTTLAINMLTDGGFDPEVLEQHFKREIVPQNVLTCKFNALKRAKASVPDIKKFGREIKEVVPIWYPSEIREILEQGRFSIDQIDSSLLWGQSTAIRVTGKK